MAEHAEVRYSVHLWRVHPFTVMNGPPLFVKTTKRMETKGYDDE